MQSELTNGTVQIPLLYAALAGLITFLTGSGGVALLLWWLNRRQYKADVVPKEAAGIEDILEKLKGLVEESVQNAFKMRAYETTIQALKTQIEIRDSEINRQGKQIRDILVEQGASKERERQCQENLSHVNEKLEEYGDLAQINKKLVKDNLQLRGSLDECLKQA